MKGDATRRRDVRQRLSALWIVLLALVVGWLVLRGWVLIGVFSGGNLGYEELSDRSIAAFGEIAAFLPDPDASPGEVFAGAPHPGQEAIPLIVETLFGDRKVRHGHIFTHSRELSPELLDLLIQPEAYTVWAGTKGCGGFHADLFVAWPGQDRALMICAGCEEALVFRGDQVIRADLQLDTRKRVARLIR